MLQYIWVFNERRPAVESFVVWDKEQGWMFLGSTLEEFGNKTRFTDNEVQSLLELKYKDYQYELVPENKVYSFLRAKGEALKVKVDLDKLEVDPVEGPEGPVDEEFGGSEAV